MGKNKCSFICCPNKAEVLCECTDRLFFCSAHGYEHFLSSGHELKDISTANLDLKFLDIDFALLKGLPVKSIDINEGTSLFRKAMLKHLKKSHTNKHKKFGISSNLKKYLFEVKYKVPCFVCEKGVGHIKLHLVNKHGFDQEARQDYWNKYQDSYSNMGTHFRDII